MTRNLKALGLAAVTALALSVATTSAASAATHHFNAGPATHLTGEAKTAQEFIATPVDLQYMKCTTTSLEGTVEGGAVASLTVTPSYSNCGLYKEKEELAALFVETNSCHYVFTGKTLESEVGKHANVELECDEAGDHIEIKATALKLSCISIPAQTVSGVRYANKETGGIKDFEVEATMRGITSTTTNSLACPTKSGSTETHNNGTYLGTVTVKGHNEAKEPASISTSEGPDGTHNFVTDTNVELASESIGVQEFKASTDDEGGYRCKKVTLESGSSGGTATSLSVLPKYDECETFNPTAFFEVRQNGCHFLFTGVTTKGNPTFDENEEHAGVHIQCPVVEGVEKEIEIRVTASLKLKCADIPSQEVEDAVRYTNETTENGKTHVRVVATAHSVKSTTTGVCGEGTHEDGSYTGEVTLKGKSGESVSISTT